MTFGEYMKQAMNMSGISQAELARTIGVARSTINGYVSGRRTKIGLPTLNAISHALDLDALVILTECTELDIRNTDFLSNTRHPDGIRLQRLNTAFNKLNTGGQAEAVKRVEELTEIPRYTAPDSDREA